ncbi:hypothetical protein ACQKJG_18320 [Priestia megaterium]|uniref:hypothetical protein n=1 Tax=Priestia megaterium TaxID=1404 RepID=UPI003D08BB88
MIEIVKVPNFEERKASHDQKMQEEHYRYVTEQLSFKKGTKLQLSIEVTDEFFSQSILSLLHDKISGGELLGFKVTEVCMNPKKKTEDEVKQVLQSVIDNLQEFVKR